MTELEKIAYAKSFIDKLANGINPLDDTPIPEDDIANNVRLSRCFFFVSDVLRQVIEKEAARVPKENKPRRRPFSLTLEQRQSFEYTETPISATAFARKLNNLVRDKIDEKKMKRLSYKKIMQWLLNLGMIEFREWENGKMKRFPTADGESLGLNLQMWENNGRRTPVVYFTEEAQRFVVDNLDAVIATEVIKNKKVPIMEETEESNEDMDE